MFLKTDYSEAIELFEPNRTQSNQFDFLTVNRTECFFFLKSSIRRTDQLNKIHHRHSLIALYSVHFEVRFDRTELITKNRKNN
jgi:hypothetical protein